MNTSLVVVSKTVKPARYLVRCSECNVEDSLSWDQLDRAKKYKAPGCRHCRRPFRHGPRGSLRERCVNLLYSQYKTKAKVRGIEWELSREQFEEYVIQSCHYCNSDGSPRSDFTGSDSYVLCGIDRLDPKQGYYEGNCVPCCMVCNRAKRDMTYDEFKNWALALTGGSWYN